MSESYGATGLPQAYLTTGRKVCALRVKRQGSRQLRPEAAPASGGQVGGRVRHRPGVGAEVQLPPSIAPGLELARSQKSVAGHSVESRQAAPGERQRSKLQTAPLWQHWLPQARPAAQHEPPAQTPPSPHGSPSTQPALPPPAAPPELEPPPASDVMVVPPPVPPSRVGLVTFAWLPHLHPANATRNHTARLAKAPRPDVDAREGNRRMGAPSESERAESMPRWSAPSTSEKSRGGARPLLQLSVRLGARAGRVLRPPP